MWVEDEILLEVWRSSLLEEMMWKTPESQMAKVMGGLDWQSWWKPLGYYVAASKEGEVGEGSLVKE
jgi:hypothetical protein